MTEKPAQEVAVVEDVRPPLVVSQRKAGAIVPTTVEQAYRMAQAIVRGGMAPKSYENNPERVMVAIMHGMEVGLTPMAAIQSIAVINGFPTIWGDGALGLCEASGLLEDIDEQLVQTGEEVVATCTIRRKGRKTPIVGRFSMSDARRAGLGNKVGPWQQYPQRMLKMRARSWALRDAFADVLRGLQSAEEIIDMGDAPLTAARRPTRAEVAAIIDPVRPVDEKELDRAFKATMGGSGLNTDPVDEVEHTEAGPAPPAAKPSVPLVTLYASAKDKAVGDWKRFAEDCMAAINALPDVEHVEAWGKVHAERLKQMPPSLADGVREALRVHGDALSGGEG